jgi:hypothetical protein
MRTNLSWSFHRCWQKPEIVDRSIVQVNVSQEGSVRIHAVQEPREAKEKTTRSRLTEDEFWGRLGEKAPGAIAPAKRIIEHFRGKESVLIKPMEGSISVCLAVPGSSQRITLFLINTDGAILCWPWTISGQLKRAGLDGEQYASYYQGLLPLLPGRNKIAIYAPVEQVDGAVLFGVVEAFIEQVLAAAPN